MNEYKIKIEKGNDQVAKKEITNSQQNEGLFAMCACGRPWWIHATPDHNYELPYRRNRG